MKELKIIIALTITLLCLAVWYEPEYLVEDALKPYTKEYKLIQQIYGGI